MELYQKVRSTFADDEGVSPVIAVILMVAITVVLAATVYVWVSGFASQDSGPEQASATARGFEVGGSDVNWIRVTLTKGENAPYDEGQVNYTVLDPSGNSYNAKSVDSGSSNDVLCTAAKATGSQKCNAEDFHETGATNTWDVGQTLYVPCQESGDHSITISIKGTTLLDSSVDCDAAA